MTKLTKEIREDIKQYVLNGITSDDVVLNTDKDKLQHALNRFNEEYGFNVARMGQRKAFAEWLQGLALDYDFYNCDILDIAKRWGQPIETEKQQDNIINGWWDFLTHQFFKLVKHYKIEQVV